MQSLIQFFEYEHLRKDLQDISKPFCDVALLMDSVLPANLEKSAMMRKLLEAKDCAVRARLYKEVNVEKETLK